MLDTIKPLLSDLLMPLPFSLLLIFVGLITLYWHKLAGASVIFTGWLLLLIFSLTPVSRVITASLENQYRPLVHKPRNIRYIVVLGGGGRANPELAPANTQLAASSLSRLVEGVRLYKALAKKNPSVQLILSGGTVFRSPQNTNTIRNTAVMLGVPRKQVILERGLSNTFEEASYIKKIVGKKPFILVTSATHMHRSMRLFEANGTHPIAAPTHFLSRIKETDELTLKPIPSARNLRRSGLSIHEYLGLFWFELTYHPHQTQSNISQR